MHYESQKEETLFLLHKVTSSHVLAQTRAMFFFVYVSCAEARLYLPLTCFCVKFHSELQILIVCACASEFALML